MKNSAGSACGGGFTLVELMIVVAIMAILLSMAVPAYQSTVESAKMTSALSDLRSISMEVENFIAQNGVPPESLAEIGMDGERDPWGNPYVYLSVQVEDESLARPAVTAAALSLLERYLRGNTDVFQFLSDLDTLTLQRADGVGVGLNHDFDCYSVGPDGDSHPKITAWESLDDILRADNGGFFGPVSRYR